MSLFNQLIKISTLQGGRRGAVQRCLPSFQQRRWRYFPNLDFLSVGCKQPSIQKRRWRYFENTICPSRAVGCNRELTVGQMWQGLCICWIISVTSWIAIANLSWTELQPWVESLDRASASEHQNCCWWNNETAQALMIIISLSGSVICTVRAKKA